jgi:uncharacterized protein YyaL (SSP411 family)
MKAFTAPMLAGLFVLVSMTVPGAAAERLTDATSPYLQLHKADPVDWWPWGPEALAEAERLDRPILLSIGYLACHWCHVMQDENFTDPETAAMMNEKFVNILVDREERPDIDALYQEAAAMMGLPGGWPMNIFLTPEGRPFYGGLYFPPEAELGMPAFREVLGAVSDTWREDPANVQLFGFRIMSAIEASSAAKTGAAPPAPAQLNSAWRAMLEDIDPFNGGFGESAKYPRVPAMLTLWRAWLRAGDEAFRDAVVMSVNAMAQGAMYDHLGGGFARYTEDPDWMVPHFEKMLDINAQMVALMTEVWRETRAPLLKARTEETVAFLLREMRMENGAFGSALDADSLNEAGEKEEGAFFVWSEAEVDKLLGDDAPLFKRAYDVTAGGNWEGVNILHRLRATTDELAAAFGHSAQEVEDRLTRARARLFKAREKRPRPNFDDKAVADWNGLAIAALAEAGAAFDRPEWIAAAAEAYGFLRQALIADGRMHRYTRAGRLEGMATTEDHALMGRAALTLFEVTGTESYLADARAHAAEALAHWDEKGGGFYQVAVNADPALPAMKIGYDGQMPSGNAAMAELMGRLYYMTGDGVYRDHAKRTLAAFSDVALGFPIDYGAMLSAADTLAGSVQVVIIGARSETRTDALLAEAWRTALPGRVLQVIAPGAALPDGHPAQYKEQVEGQATAYVCVGSFCSLPQTEPGEFAEAMKFVRRTGKAGLPAPVR